MVATKSSRTFFSWGKTQSLKEIADDVTIEDNNIINAAMAKCSTYMYGHDNATELAVDCPRYSEVEQDVASLDTYFKILKNVVANIIQRLI